MSVQRDSAYLSEVTVIMAEEANAGSSPIPQPPDHLSVLPPATKGDDSATVAVEELSEEANQGEVAQGQDDAAGECLPFVMPMMVMIQADGCASILQITISVVMPS